MGSLIMRSRTMVFLCVTLLGLAPAAAQERMYKCIDARGRVYYTQVPPPECLRRDTQEHGGNPFEPRAGAGARGRAQEEKRGRREIQGRSPQEPGSAQHLFQ